MSDMLSTALSGLNASQQLLDTVGHNVANAGTPGYSRQVGQLQANMPTEIGSYFVGNGVSFVGNIRQVDQFLETAYLNATASYQQESSYSTYAGVIDNLIADPNTSISEGMYGFFNALQEVINDPAFLPARQVFLSQANILETRFSQLDAKLLNQNSQINAQVTQLVVQINDYANSIAQLNIEIVASRGSSSAAQPNDLLDQRDYLIEQLSNLVGVTVIQQGTGAADVFIGKGFALVVGGTTQGLAAEQHPGDPQRIEVGIGATSGVDIISDTLSGGTLGGILQMRLDIIEPTRNALGRLAVTIASVLNEQHIKGMDLNGNLGEFLFKDVNDVAVSQNRVQASQDNTGTAVFSLNIDPIPRSPKEPPILFSTIKAVNTVAGALNPLSVNNLTINDIPIIASGADGVSTSDSAASSIAIAKAINTSRAIHHVTAAPLETVAYLGTFTPGTYVSGNLTINGSEINGSFATAESLVVAINSFTTVNGVKAQMDSNGHVSLLAPDGRNIQLQTNGIAPAATFQFLATNGGTELNNVQNAALKLEGPAPGSIIKVGGTAPVNAGLAAGTTPFVTTSLSTNNYQLLYTGTAYSLIRDDGLTINELSPNFTIDGFTLTLEYGTMKAGDSFYLYPTRYGSSNFIVQINQPALLAVGVPVDASAALSNQGTGLILVNQVTDTSGKPGAGAQLGNAFQTSGILIPPLLIEFITPTSYVVYDVTFGAPGVQIGDEQIYDPRGINELFPLPGVTDLTGPGPRPPYVWDPGYRITMTGAVSTGDQFNIGYNTNGVSDNRNALEMLAISYEPIMQNQTSSFQDSYSQMVATVGSLTQSANVNSQATLTLQRATQDQRDAVSGVNLDEEASNLMRYEQLYSACAQLILTARTIFDTLISVIGR